MGSGCDFVCCDRRSYPGAPSAHISLGCCTHDAYDECLRVRLFPMLGHLHCESCTTDLGFLLHCSPSEMLIDMHARAPLIMSVSTLAFTVNPLGNVAAALTRGASIVLGIGSTFYSLHWLLELPLVDFDCVSCPYMHSRLPNHDNVVL